MLHTLLLLCMCTLAFTAPYMKANVQRNPHDTYSHSLTLAYKIHEDVQNLLPSYDAVRLQQDSEYLLVFNHHINNCYSSEHQSRNFSTALELLQLNIRDLQALITQQLVLLQQPAVSTAALTAAPVCNTGSVWLSHMEGYIVLKGLERCAQKVVRDYTLLCHQQQ
ncbi:hypothetical protein COCON_G00078230 [Conger conger]|uniref:Uncharacterized protein n=1 Tax=Conger conger TaxID=82655 RepID=A0A9Q1DPA0_CONCO|nr:hypothetical protein COCON_G00078230 [Conger conger]